MTAPRDPGADRAVDVALAEFNALRAELLGHSTGQTTVLGLGFTAIGVLAGIAINAPDRRGLLILLPLLCAVLILVYSGLAYRVVVVGNYIRSVLWPFLERRLRVPDLPSWEASLAELEDWWPHRLLSQVVELALVALLFGVGVVGLVAADGTPAWFRWVAGVVLVVATVVGLMLGRRRRLATRLLTPATGSRPPAAPP